MPRSQAALHDIMGHSPQGPGDSGTFRRYSMLSLRSRQRGLLQAGVFQRFLGGAPSTLRANRVNAPGAGGR